jgi:ankyrin repeat protein
MASQRRTIERRLILITVGFVAAGWAASGVWMLAPPKPSPTIQPHRQVVRMRPDGDELFRIIASGDNFDALARAIAADSALPKDDTRGYTWLWQAAKYGRSDCVHLLLAKGADPNHRSDPLSVAARNGNRECAALIWRYGGRSDDALPLAAANGHASTVVMLLAVGADVNRPNCAGETALHAACRANQQSSARILLANGAAINAMDKTNRTPLDHAMYYGHAQLSLELMRAGGIRGTPASDAQAR